MSAFATSAQWTGAEIEELCLAVTAAGAGAFWYFDQLANRS